MPTKDKAIQLSSYTAIGAGVMFLLSAFTPLSGVIESIRGDATVEASTQMQLTSIQKSVDAIPGLERGLAEINVRMQAFETHASDTNLHMAESEKFTTFLPRREYELAEKARVSNESRRSEEVNRRLGELDKKSDRIIEILMDKKTL